MPASAPDEMTAHPASNERLYTRGLRPVILLAAAFVITLLSFFQFPGHTILQSDTQIYIPILERLWDPSTFANDILAARPHVSFTLYDEIALGLRAVTGASFETILMSEQFVYRLAGVLAIYFIASALGLSPAASLLVAAILSLGATISGPAVLTIEYEPVPRGFALPLMLASIALAAYGRWMGAAAFATIAFAFHPPTALAYCALLLFLLLKHRQFTGIAALAIGPAAMILSILLAGGSQEAQSFFGQIDPGLEALQRMRASYNWVSIWLGTWKFHYLFVCLTWMIALWRIRGRIPEQLMLFFAGLPLIGILSIPTSYVLLEKAKWVLIPQFQPGRYLLFVTLMASLLSSIAAIAATERRRWIEAVLFFTIAFAIPMDSKVTNILGPENVTSMQRLALSVALAVLAVLATAVSGKRGGYAAITIAAIVPFFAIPSAGKVRNYAPLHHAELDQLVEWARQNTSKDAVFQFADAGRDLPPGVFRARALRALYADWKAGGQVNFHKEFSTLWWDRWRKVEEPLTLDAYRDLGIDYVIFKTVPNAPASSTAIYSNEKYLVYKLK
jgi:hypothetical protein